MVVVLGEGNGGVEGLPYASRTEQEVRRVEGPGCMIVTVGARRVVVECGLVAW